MDLLVFGILFWMFAIITILLKMKTHTRTMWRTGIKAIPAILASIFVFITLPSTLFYILLMIALAFCALGDIGMEYNILPGLGLFLFAHIFFIGNFLMQSLVIGLTLIPLTIFITCFIVMLIYTFFYYRYIQSTKQEIPNVLLKSVIVYALMISLTLSTSLLLWLTTNASLGFIPFIGTCFFVASDSMIGIKEFHHHYQNEEAFILSSYYLAIFLISLGAIIYTF